MKSKYRWKQVFLAAAVLLMWVDTIDGGNLALQQPVKISSLYRSTTVAQNAVDGNPASVYTGSRGALTAFSANPWWQVDLGNTYVIDDVFMIGRSDCCWSRLQGAVITVGDNEDGSLNNKCATMEKVTSPVKRSFKCSTGIRGRYVTIRHAAQRAIITLYEVMVNQNPTENLALKKASAQSSRSHDGYSARAVDGNRDGRYGAKSCTHTHQQTNPWWRVDLGTTRQVSEVFIVNRVGVKQRLVNIEIRVGDSLADNGNANPRCGGTYSMATLFKASFYCKPRKPGRYLNIRLAAAAMILTLCEVEVYSESKAFLPDKPKDPTMMGPVDVLVQLTCPEPFGYPGPYVAWLRDGIVYQNTTTDLVFNRRELKDRRNQSVWECVVSNKHGTDFHQFVLEGSYKMCVNYQDLQATDRSIHTSGNTANDKAINESVWFRFIDSTSSALQIPESCVSPTRCSTQATGWMFGSHPSKEDGVVERTACFSWDGNCCKYNTSIFVRHCHGYFVYKLRKTSFAVNAAYCAVRSRSVDPDIMFHSVLNNNESNYALEGHVIDIERDLTVDECLSVCLSCEYCTSINYQEQFQICELNNATRTESADTNWMKRLGNQYYEKVQLLSFTP